MTKVKEAPLDKGSIAEEALRNYFRSVGAFVLRGVPLREGADEITDVDLWIYTRASAHARFISIVDIKNKKRAKGYERIIWFRGLQSALKADEAIVATIGVRENLKPFADRMGVKLLSQQVFRSVLDRYGNDSQRLTSEQIEQLWRPVRIDSATSLHVRMRSNLEEVALGISFSALNTWIDEAAALLVYSLDHEKTPGPIMRAVFLCSALVSIAGDYLGRDLAFLDYDARRSHFRNGLMFGRADPSTARSFVGFAEKLVTDFVDHTGASAATIRTGFAKAAEHLPVNHFIELFSRPSSGKELIEAAIDLESAAFSANMYDIAALSSQAKTILFLIADYAGVERRKLISRGQTQEAQNARSDAPNPVVANDGRLL